ncbi:MAG: hypothetical protein IPK60_22930 [Sandaracinaceae bacterium]|nr:hypothetical protein [Sandaracinaceae bacterium]
MISPAGYEREIHGLEDKIVAMRREYEAAIADRDKRIAKLEASDAEDMRIKIELVGKVLATYRGRRNQTLRLNLSDDMERMLSRIDMALRGEEYT